MSEVILSLFIFVIFPFIIFLIIKHSYNKGTKGRV